MNQEDKESIQSILEILKALRYSFIPKGFASIEAAVDFVKSMTQKLWTNNHSDLVELLDENNTDRFADISLLWFECFKFPYQEPVVRKSNGKPIEDFSILGTDFNETSYHDSIINSVKDGKKSILFELLLIEEWKEERKNENGPCTYEQVGSKYTLEFQNIFKLFKVDTDKSEECLIDSLYMNDQTIYGFYEIPALKYYLEENDIPTDIEINKFRMFKLSYDLEEYSELIIFSKSFALRKVSDDSICIGRAIVPKSQ